MTNSSFIFGNFEFPPHSPIFLIQCCLNPQMRNPQIFLKKNKIPLEDVRNTKRNTPEDFNQGFF